MNIDTELFRVLDDADIDLKDTPTIIKPFYRSKKDYRNILDEDTVELRDQQSVLNASGPASIRKAVTSTVSRFQPKLNSNTIFYGDVSSSCLNGEKSVSSTVPIMKTYWLFAFIRKFWQNRNFPI